MTDMKIFPLFMILIAVLLRLMPHPANVAPITAIALFSGVYLPKRFAFILPIVALLISDYFIGFYGFEMIFVYGSFLISGLIGLWVRSHKGYLGVLGGALLASILFYLITNFGVWADPRSWYSKDIAGLFNCYIAAIPFFRNTLLGDLFYTGLFFGGYELMKNLAKKYLPKSFIKTAF